MADARDVLIEALCLEMSRTFAAEYVDLQLATLAAAGFAVVPVEPTAQMRIDAGDLGDGYDLTASQVVLLYQAMLAAAPKHGQG